MSARSSHKPSFAATRALVLAVALPLAAVGLGGCGGGGSGSTSTDGAATASSGPAIVAAGKGSSGSARAKTGASSRTRTTTAPEASTGARTTGAVTTAPAGSSGSGSTHGALSGPGKGAVLRRFAGFGDTRLGTIVVRSAQVLQWRTARAPIQIFAANGFMLVNSTAPSGSIHLSRGTYRSVRVAAHASWSIELRTPAP
jgi:hypothetical protein